MNEREKGGNGRKRGGPTSVFDAAVLGGGGVVMAGPAPAVGGGGVASEHTLTAMRWKSTGRSRFSITCVCVDTQRKGGRGGEVRVVVPATTRSASALPGG